MIRNYLKITLRTLWKSRLYTGIQVLGLVLGMTACLLLLDYVGFQMSFDRFHAGSDRIYRLINDRYQDGKRVQLGTITYPSVGPAMQREFPEIEQATRLFYNGDLLVRRGGEIDRVENALFVDRHFLEMFSFRMLAARQDTLLARANEVVLTRRLADRYFPEAAGNYSEVLGRSLRFDRREDPYEIVGVLEEVPANSTLQFDLLISYETVIRYIGPDADEHWQWSDFYHYFKLREGAEVDALEAKFAGFSQRHFRGQEVSGSEEHFYLQPMHEAHLHSDDLEYEIGQTANGQAIWALLIIAFFILIIAWMNYVNLTSVRAVERAREVGIRKVVGARRRQLIGQFLTEALLVNGISLLLALQLLQLVRPWFGRIVGFSTEEVGLFRYAEIHTSLLLTAAVLAGAGILISGAYPAWLLSGQQMSDVLKGGFRGPQRSQWVRQGLVVFQFTASIALIAGTLLVYRQIRFLNEKDLGLQVEQVLMVDPPQLSQWDSTFIERMNSFKEALTAYPEIRSATTSSRVPGQGTGRIFDLQLTGSPTDQTYMSNFIHADYGYADTYGLRPVAGRFFRPSDHSPDPEQIRSVVVNEALTGLLGFAAPQEAVGRQLRFWGRDMTVVGVVPDFHQRSLHHHIEPLVFMPFYGTQNPLSVRIAGKNIPATVALISTLYDRFFPGNAFEYRFVDELFQKQYESDRQFGRVLSFFTIVAIFIAVLGLFGLAAFSIALRTKEVGVRKVLGASVVQLVRLLSGDFLRLVLIALLCGLPLAYYGIRLWLNNFAYEQRPAWWIFVATALLVFILAFATVSMHAIRAAYRNPVEALRNE